MSKMKSARFWAMILLTVTFCIMSIRGDIAPEMYAGILTLCLGFYFHRKRKEEDE